MLKYQTQDIDKCRHRVGFCESTLHQEQSLLDQVPFVFPLRILVHPHRPGKSFQFRRQTTNTEVRPPYL